MQEKTKKQFQYQKGGVCGKFLFKIKFEIMEVRYLKL